VIATGLRGRPPEQKAAIVAAFDREVVPALASGEMRPVIDRVFPLEAVVDAHRLLELGDVIGKVVLQVAAG
jgi:NADPH:quinone reductase-like Zn-dependent oxidoreductase